MAWLTSYVCNARIIAIGRKVRFHQWVTLFMTKQRLRMNLAISGCLRHSPKGKKPNNWLQKNIAVYPPIAKRFWYFDDEFLKKKRRKYNVDCFLPPDFLGYWIFVNKFNNAFTSTLAILAALDSNLVANLGLRKYSPSFICTSAAYNSRLSWWAV